MTTMNIASILRQATDRHPDNIALSYEDKRYTYAQFNARINRIAHSLADLGVCPGDRVGMYMPNSEASAICYFACQKLGAVAVPMNFRLAWREAVYVLRDSGSRVLVYTEDLADNVTLIEREVPGLHSSICVCEDASTPELDGHLDYEQLASTFPNASEPAYAPDGGDLSALVYTSGTTGRPKGVMHTHANDVAIAMNCVMEYGLRHTDRALHIAPLYHVGGMQAFFMPHLFVGGHNVLLRGYDSVQTLQTIEHEGITTLFAVPVQITQMLQHERFSQFDVGTLRLITTGGSALAAAMMQRVQRDFCPNLFNGYGMTEASLTLLLHPEHVLAELGTCGKPTLVTESRIVCNIEGREVLPHETVERDEVGQLIVRGPQVMKGYWNKPIETDERLKYGWFYTGDLFSRNQRGFYRYHGRADDMIVSGGENIYPREVEEVLYQMPGIRECHVLGLPSERWGQEVTAFVVRSDPALSAEDIEQFCKTSDDLADFKRPRRVLFLESLPRNASGKVVKPELLAYAERHAS